MVLDDGDPKCDEFANVSNSTWPYPKVLFRSSEALESLKPHAAQQGAYFHADEYVPSAEFIGLIDTDTLFMSSVRNADLFDEDGRPFVVANPSLPALNDWWLLVPLVTETILQLPAVLRGMNYFPVVVKRAHLAELRAFVSAQHGGKPFDLVWTEAVANHSAPQHHFDDLGAFDVIVTYLWHLHRGEYAFRIQRRAVVSTSLCPDSWSLGPKDLGEPLLTEPLPRVAVHGGYFSGLGHDKGLDGLSSAHVNARDGIFELGWCMSGGLLFGVNNESNSVSIINTASNLSSSSSLSSAPWPPLQSLDPHRCDKHHSKGADQHLWWKFEVMRRMGVEDWSWDTRTHAILANHFTRRWQDLCAFLELREEGEGEDREVEGGKRRRRRRERRRALSSSTTTMTGAAAEDLRLRQRQRRRRLRGVGERLVGEDGHVAATVAARSLEQHDPREQQQERQQQQQQQQQRWWESPLYSWRQQCDSLAGPRTFQKVPAPVVPQFAVKRKEGEGGTSPPCIIPGVKPNPPLKETALANLTLPPAEAPRTPLPLPSSADSPQQKSGEARSPAVHQPEASPPSSTDPAPLPGSSLKPAASTTSVLSPVVDKAFESGGRENAHGFLNRFFGLSPLF